MATRALPATRPPSLTRLSAGESSSRQRGRPGARASCRSKATETTVDVVCWGCREEDFCLPGPGAPGCQNCENICIDQADNGKTRPTPKQFTWREWRPWGCPTLHTRRKLLMRTIIPRVPRYQYVIES